MKLIPSLVLVLGAGGVLAGCGNSEPAPAPGPDPAAATQAPTAAAPAVNPVDLEASLLARFRELPAAGRDQVDLNAAVGIASQLREMGPNGLKPLLEMLGENPGDPLLKMLVVVGMTQMTSVNEQARLIELTQPEVEVTGRACAATLLSFLDTPEANARTTQLLDDPDRRVRVATIIAMLPRNLDAVNAKIAGVLADPETTVAELQQILFGMPDTLWGAHLEAFAAAAGNEGLSDGARERAIQALGQLGNRSHLDGLMAVAKAPKSSGLVIVRSYEAQDAIRAREGMPALSPADIGDGAATGAAPVPAPAPPADATPAP